MTACGLPCRVMTAGSPRTAPSTTETDWEPSLRGLESGRQPALILVGRNLQGFESSPRFIWLPVLDTYRTMCVAPQPDFLRVLEEIRELDFAA